MDPPEEPFVFRLINPLTGFPLGPRAIPVTDPEPYNDSGTLTLLGTDETLAKYLDGWPNPETIPALDLSDQCYVTLEGEKVYYARKTKVETPEDFPWEDKPPENSGFEPDLDIPPFEASTTTRAKLQNVEIFRQKIVIKKVPKKNNVSKLMKIKLFKVKSEGESDSLANVKSEPADSWGIMDQSSQSTKSSDDFTWKVTTKLDSSASQKPKTHCCNLCQSFFHLKSELKEHQVTCKYVYGLTERSPDDAESNKHICNLCQTGFREKKDLKEHLATCKIIFSIMDVPQSSAPEVYMCNQCPKSFSSIESLECHFLVCGTRKFSANGLKSKISYRVCKFCDATFVNLRHLKDHIRICQNLPESAKQACSSFASKPDFGQPTSKTATRRSKIHVCSDCKRTFTKRIYLENHKKNPCGSLKAATSPSLTCDRCLMPFKTRKNLRRHLKKCSAIVGGKLKLEEVFFPGNEAAASEMSICFCDFCKMAFASESDLETHKITCRIIYRLVNDANPQSKEP